MIHLSDAWDLDKVGGKARHLCSLIKAGLLIKNGLVITIDEVDDILASGKVPQVMSDEIVKLLQFPVAVRSSAVGEDGADVSWAGQFKTKLFVSPAEVEEAIFECAAARDSDNVLAYAAEHHLVADKLALIVQEMVDATCAGVLFTTNPRDSQCREMVIEVVEGVGEKLVNGSYSPRRYHLNEDGTVIAIEGASLPELTDVQLAELATLGQKVRDLFGREQDIEWAIERGTGILWLLQSRDITALHQKNKNFIMLRRNQVIDEIQLATNQEFHRLADLGLKVKSDVWSDQNVAELLTPHPCQMAFDLFTTIFAHDGAICRGRNELGYEIGPELDTGFFQLIGGQPRCSIVHDACTYRVRGFSLPEYGKLVEYYLARIGEDNRLGNYPEVVLYDQDPPLRFLIELYGEKRGRELRTAYGRFFDGLRPIEDTFNNVCQRQFIPRWQKTMRALRDNPPACELSALICRFDHLIKLLRDDACVAFVKGARLGFFAFARLRKFLQELFGSNSEQYLSVVTAGIPMERNPNLRLNVALSEVHRGVKSLETVCREYGHLALHELEISIPRHADNPAFLIQLVEQTRGDPLGDLQNNEVRSREVILNLLRDAGHKAAELEREIQMARTYLSLREMIKFEYLKAYQLIRQALCDMERVLEWDEGLVFQLNVKEVALLEHQNQTMEQLARKRRAEREAEKLIFIPSVFNTDNLENIGNPRVSGDDRFLYGIGATNEIAEGEAVVMRHFNDREAMAQLKPGMILVTATTDPAWSPVLALVGKTGGLVTEIGGLLAHGAIYAREMGFAAVLNVPQATTRIQTGMRIRVHGPGGYVELIRK